MDNKSDLNVGICDAKQIAVPYVFNCLNVDLLRVSSVDVVCDIHHLPFRSRAFRDVYCFHVLEHITNPARGLSELVRVARRKIEVEVPHRLGMHAKTPRRDRGKPDFCHVSSFRVTWFRKCLKNFKHLVKVHFDFPWDLLIHVWVYKDGWEKID